jgi:endonuclease/exonuclease/phosphatase family metal-dependent hydrolase
MSILAHKFSKYPYVIICGDFNVSDKSEYSPFLRSGFSLANSVSQGTLYTYPSQSPTTAVDNVIVKGFVIDHADTVNDTRLSDHSLIRASLIFPFK